MPIFRLVLPVGSQGMAWANGCSRQTFGAHRPAEDHHADSQESPAAINASQ